MNLRNQNVEVNEELDACKRLIKTLQTEIADLSEQLEGGGKTAHEVWDHYWLVSPELVIAKYKSQISAGDSRALKSENTPL